MVRPVQLGERLAIYQPTISQDNLTEVAGPTFEHLARPFAALPPHSYEGDFRFRGELASNVVPVSFDYPDAGGTPRVMSDSVQFIADPQFRTLKAGLDPEDKRAIDSIRPTVVRVSAVGAQTAQQKAPRWFGSGSIVNPNDVLPDYLPQEGEYFVMTNHHVTDGAKYMNIELPNGTEVMADVVYSPYSTPLMDEEMDIAILRFYFPASLPTAKIGDPASLEIGETIYTAGHPYALPRSSITRGIVSQTEQETGSLSLDIQIDAPINPGNSGGPAFNSKGEIMGTDTYTLSKGEDLTFVKPIDQQLAAIRKIWSDGMIIRGSLGFEVDPYPIIDRNQDGFPSDMSGAIVSGVAPGSTVANAGLRVGDVVTWMEVRRDGAAIKTLPVEITDVFEAGGVIRRWLADIFPGTKVTLIVYRKVGNHYETVEISAPAEMLVD
jgi:S1-C subfamily serine protease